MTTTAACSFAVAAAIALLGRGALADPAPAPPPKPEKPVKIDLEAGTQFPMSVTLKGTVEVPYRILFDLEVGWLPRPYAYAFNDVLHAFGSYDDNIATLIQESIDNSPVVRVSAGWRPFPAHGFEAFAGYTLIALGGGATASEVIDTVLGEAGSSQRVPIDSQGKEIPLHSTLHNFHATLGWRWLFANDHLVVRAQLSYVQCVASSSSVDLSGKTRVGAAALSALNQDFSSYLNGVYTTYVKAPVFGVLLGYRF